MIRDCRFDPVLYRKLSGPEAWRLQWKTEAVIRRARAANPLLSDEDFAAYAGDSTHDGGFVRPILERVGPRLEAYDAIRAVELHHHERAARRLQGWARDRAARFPDTRHGCMRRAPASFDPDVPPSAVADIQRASLRGETYEVPRRPSGHLQQTTPAHSDEDIDLELQALAFMLMSSSVSKESYRAYAYGLRKWFIFRDCRGKPPWFDRQEDPLEMEQELLKLYTYYAVKCNYAPSTLHGYLYGIRKYHEGVDIRIDLTTMMGLKAARAGWLRIAGKGLRTTAVTSEIVVNAIVNGGQPGDDDSWDELLA